MTYWINVAARGEVLEGARAARFEKLVAQGDRVVFYAPRSDQRFTAIGEIGEGRQLQFLKSDEADVRPLIDNLEFIPNKTAWGVTFRRGLFRIGESDFQRIAKAMNADV